MAGLGRPLAILESAGYGGSSETQKEINVSILKQAKVSAPNRLTAALIAMVLAFGLFACGGTEEDVQQQQAEESSPQDRLDVQEQTLALFRTSIVERQTEVAKTWQSFEPVSEAWLSDGSVEQQKQAIDSLNVLSGQILAIDSYRLGLDDLEDRVAYGELVIVRMSVVTSNLLGANHLMYDMVERDELGEDDAEAILDHLQRAAEALDVALPPPK